MENQTTQFSLKDSILAKIDDGGVKMVPKWHFVFMTVITGLGVAVTFFVVLFLTTFVLFALHQAGTGVLPEFGLPGVKGFFSALPWIPIAIAIVLAVLLEILLLRYAFAYKQPLLYSVLLVAGVIALSSVIVGVAKVHERVYTFSEDQQVPLIQPFYRAFAEPEDIDIHRGIIDELHEHNFILRSIGGQTVIVNIVPQTRIVPTTAVRVGEFVVVFGEDEDGVVRAIGVHALPGRVRPQMIRP
ncbi:MAG: hypothetical protein WC802_01885 [Patescibacteria group bacterium]|jgi:hypothetical protein